MAQLTRQSLMAVAMGMYGSFAGKLPAEVSALDGTPDETLRRGEPVTDTLRRGEQVTGTLRRSGDPDDPLWKHWKPN